MDSSDYVPFLNHMLVKKRSRGNNSLAYNLKILLYSGQISQIKKKKKLKRLIKKTSLCCFGGCSALPCRKFNKTCAPPDNDVIFYGSDLNIITKDGEPALRYVRAGTCTHTAKERCVCHNKKGDTLAWDALWNTPSCFIGATLNLKKKIQMPHGRCFLSLIKLSHTNEIWYTCTSESAADVSLSKLWAHCSLTLHSRHTDQRLYEAIKQKDQSIPTNHRPFTRIMNHVCTVLISQFVIIQCHTEILHRGTTAVSWFYIWKVSVASPDFWEERPKTQHISLDVILLLIVSDGDIVKFNKSDDDIWADMDW